MIRNLTRDALLASHAVEAKSTCSRMRGMLGRQFAGFDAMLFRNNNSIHMWFMRIPLDVVFVDRNGTILKVRHTLKPWRMTGCLRATSVIELPAGVLRSTGCEVGDRLEITPLEIW